MIKRTNLLYLQLFFAAILIGLLCALLFFSLKKITELMESVFFNTSSGNPILSILFPIVGLSIIYLLRIYLFRKKENKGIREVIEVLKIKGEKLPFYKIPSHYINGFITIIFGGSTGIEVSSVVGAATIGSVVNNKTGILKKYQAELICAGSAAAITTLFNSPLAGIFFAYEVLYKKRTRSLFILTTISALIAWLFNYLIHEEPLFNIPIHTWHTYAIPYFILLGILAGLNSVYLTKIVIHFKNLFANVSPKYLAVLSGATVIGIIIYFFPAIYGEGYLYINKLPTFDTGNREALLLRLLLILMIKPVATSLTLASGGDGGVFAPSLFIGAFLGFLLAFVLNTYFDAQVIPSNFIIIGMAAMLCASIQAPITSIFLVCGVAGNYILIVPLLIACLIARITCHLVYPFTVYNYPVKN